MGQQGSPTQAIYCAWGQSSSDITIKQTAVDATSNPAATPTTSLYCETAVCASSTPLPCTNGGTHAFSTGGIPPTLVVATTSSPSLCTSEGGTGRMSSSGEQGTIADSSSLAALLNFSSTDTLPAYNQQTRWATQYVVSSAMSSIPAVNGYENAKNFALVDRAIATQNYGTAQSLLSGIATGNTIENNWSAVDNIILKLANRDSLSSGNISALKTVAAQCPLTGGNIVWRARALLNVYYGTVINYPNNCPTVGSLTDGTNTSSRIENTSAITNKANQSITSTINLYPNPNNGSMILGYNLKNDASLEITDITGNLVGTYILPATETTMQVQNNNLQNGMYLYRVISNNTIIKQGKIVVMK